MWIPKDLRPEEVVSSFSFSSFCSRGEETGGGGGGGEGEGGTEWKAEEEELQGH